MKNDFIKNKNNVVKKPKNNYQFIAILIICIVSVCSVLGCVFSALNYFGVKPGQIYTAKADTWEPDELDGIFSYGIFSSCTFRYNAFDGDNDPGWINNYFDYSEWLVVPSNYISPFYGGFYLNSNFDYNIFYNILQDSPQKSYIVADFGDNGISLNGYTLFQVIRYISQTDGFVATGEFGSSCAFRFLDGTYLLFNNADNYFSSIDLNSYVISSNLRSIEFIAVRDYSFFTLISNVNYTNAYFSGYSDGKRVGYDTGFELGNSNGYYRGYNAGYNDGLDNANNYNFLSLMGAVVDAPIRAMTGLLNFNLLGFNMLGFFVGLLTLGLIFWVVKLLIAGKK